MPDTPRSSRLYSTYSGFWVALLGGPIAVILYAALHSWRLRRPLDAPIYLAATLGFIWLFYLLTTSAQHAPLRWLADVLGSPLTAAQVVNRACSLLYWGGFYLLHRTARLAQGTSTEPVPSPWVPAIVCGVVGFVLTRGLAELLMRSLA